MTIQILGDAEPEEVVAVLLALRPRPADGFARWRQQRIAALAGRAVRP